MRWYHFLPLFFVSFLLSAAADINISIDWDNPPLTAGKPIEGTLVVTHTAGETIDANAFSFNGKTLVVKKKSEVLLPRPENERPWLMTTYSFTLPAYPEGLHLLPKILLNHKGKVYETSPIGIQVLPASEPPTRSRPSLAAPLFLLEATYEGPTPLYPGMRGYLVYRIYFNRDLSLTEENLPLLNPEGFLKVGGVDIEERETEGLSVQQIRQEIEAKTPGTYSWGPSRLVGKLVETDQELTADAPSLSLVVQPFPDSAEIVGFTGAVGDFSLHITPPVTRDVSLGDPLVLLATITGTGNLQEIPFPSLLCQPGFSGLFSVETKPLYSSRHNEKTFRITLRPLATFLESIPPIAFSFFSPGKKEFVTLQERAIPIQVSSPPSSSIILSQEKFEIDPKISAPLPLPPLSFGTPTIVPPALWDTPYVLWVLPCGTLFWIVQYHLKKCKLW